MPSRVTTQQTILYTIAFLDCIIWGIYTPFLPALHASLQMSHATVGLYTSLMSFISFFSSPLIGKLCDKLGNPSRFLLLGSFGNCTGLLLCLTAQSREIFILGRCLQSMFRCSNVIIGVCLSDDECSASNSSQLFATLAAVQAVAFIIGPILGGYLAGIQPLLPIAAAASLCVVNILFNSMVADRVPPPDTSSPIPPHASAAKHDSRSSRILSWFPSWVTIDLLIIFVVKILSCFSQCVYESLFAQHMVSHLGLEGASLGYMLGYIGLVTTISNAFLVKPYSMFIDEKSYALVVAMAVHGSALMIWANNKDVAISMFASALATIANTVVSVYIQSVVALSCSSGKKGEIMGYVQSVERAAKAVAPFVGGYMFQRSGPEGLAVAAAAPSIACALFCVPFPVKRPKEKSDAGDFDSSKIEKKKSS